MHLAVYMSPLVAPNGLEMSRLAATGDVPWPEASCGGPVPSAQDQLQGKDTPAASPVSVSVRWQRDPAGQVGSIELLGAVQVSTSHWWGASRSKITVSSPTSTSPYLSGPARS